MMKRIAVQFSITLLLSVSAFAQNKPASLPSFSKPYWLNYSLVFFQGCQPKVLTHNIIFTDGTCSGNLREADKVFSRGAKIKIYSFSRDKGFTKVTFRYWPEMFELESEYTVLLKSQSEKEFSRSFNLLFSAKEVAEVSLAACPEELKTKAEVIRCFGFPMSVSKKGDVEEYEYAFDFVGFSYQSYDVWTIEIKNKKVIGVSGII